jgi:uncharacterized protein (DUF1499 family)
MTDHAIRATGGSRLVGHLGSLGIAVAIVALILLALAPLGFRAGWWPYSVSFQVLLTYGAYAGVAAAAIALIALVGGLAVGNRRGIVLGVLALIVGGVVAYVPWSYRQITYVLPRINDISTDTDNPPPFNAVLKMREAEKAGPSAYDPKFAADQKRAYPDIVPTLTALPPADAFNRALDAAKALGWTVVASDPAQGTIEATQSSRWMGFTDDVAIRVAARTDGQAGSRIDIRSHSRQGRHDFGVNANRVRAYTTRLRTEPGI